MPDLPMPSLALASLHPSLHLPAAAIEAFCRKWQIVRLEVFGSVLGEEFTARSDVDFLYTLSQGARVGWEIGEMEDELARLIGRPVDLVSRTGIERSENWLRRAAILDTAQVVYEA